MALIFTDYSTGSGSEPWALLEICGSCRPVVRPLDCFISLICMTVWKLVCLCVHRLLSIVYRIFRFSTLISVMNPIMLHYSVICLDSTSLWMLSSNTLCGNVLIHHLVSIQCFDSVSYGYTMFQSYDLYKLFNSTPWMNVWIQHSVCVQYLDPAPYGMFQFSKCVNAWIWHPSCMHCFDPVPCGCGMFGLTNLHVWNIWILYPVCVECLGPAPCAHLSTK